MKSSLSIFLFLTFIRNGIALHWYRDHKLKNESFKFLIHEGFRPENHELAKYVVSLRSDGKHICGGTIIKPDLILTAAHCILTTDNTEWLKVSAGSVNRLENTATTELIKVVHITVYPFYVSGNIVKNDLALLKLKHKINIDGTTRAVMDIVDKPVAAKTKCTLAGWGRLYERGPIPAEILYADLIVLSDRDCKRKIIKFSHRKGMLCAVGENYKYTDACFGDSGGPLICDNKVAGIVSFGDPACEGKSAGAYTDVFYFRNWILSFASKKHCSKSALIVACIFSLINLLQIGN